MSATEFDFVQTVSGKFVEQSICYLAVPTVLEEPFLVRKIRLTSDLPLSKTHILHTFGFIAAEL